MSSIRLQAVEFLDLPAEIRVQIYIHVFRRLAYESDGGYTRYPYIGAKSIARLLFVNWFIHSEALPIFYEHHYFRLLI